MLNINVTMQAKLKAVTTVQPMRYLLVDKSKLEVSFREPFVKSVEW